MTSDQIGAVVVTKTDGVINATYQRIDRATPGPTDLVIEPAFTGICGSDMEQLHGRMPETFQINFPHTLGHEWSGHVKAVGADVEGFTVGDQVLGHGHLGGNDWFGVTHDGAMADEFVVPARMCFHVPEGVSLKTAAVIEPFACVLQALTKIGGVNASHRVHVHGLGAIGLSTVLQAVNAGAEVVAYDPSDLRRELALKLGATAALDPTAHDDLAAATEAETGRGLADIVVEASGVAVAQATAIAGAGDNGRVLLMGVSIPRPVPALLGLVQQRNLLITSSTGAPVEIWPSAIAYVARAGIDLEPFVSSVYRFADAETAIAAAQEPGREIKVVMTP